MNTTIAIDKKTKVKAEKRAKKEGLSISTIVRIFLNEYAEGNLNIGVSKPKLTVNGFTPEFEQNVLNAMEDSEFDGPFETAKEAIKFLRSQ